MRFKNKETGDVLELPPPDRLGASVVKFNGRVVEQCLYGYNPRSVTTGDGKVFDTPDEWRDYILRRMRGDKWEA